MIRGLAKIMDTKVVIGYYHSNFQSKISYGITLWGNSSLTESVLLSQKKALRIIDNKPWNYPCRELFKKYRIMTVVNLFVFETISFSLKHGQLSAGGMEPAHRYDTRHNFHQSTAVSQREGRSSQHLAVNLFNRLPAEIRRVLKEEGQVKFKKTLKEALQECPRYSLKELVENPISIG